MKGDLYLIHNATGHVIGAFSAEEGTGGDRVAGTLAAHADEITVSLVHDRAVCVVPSDTLVVRRHGLDGRRGWTWRWQFPAKKGMR